MSDDVVKPERVARRIKRADRVPNDVLRVGLDQPGDVNRDEVVDDVEDAMSNAARLPPASLYRKPRY